MKYLIFWLELFKGSIFQGKFPKETETILFVCLVAGIFVFG